MRAGTRTGSPGSCSSTAASPPLPGHRGGALPRLAEIRSRLSGRVAAAVNTLVGRTLGWRRIGPTLRTLGQGRAVTRATSAEHRRQVSVTYARPEMWRALLREWAAYARMQASLVALRSTRPLPAIPVLVVTATRRTATGRLTAWRRMQVAQRRGLQRNDPRIAIHDRTVQPAPHLVMLTHPGDIASAVAATADEAVSGSGEHDRQTDERTA